MTKKVINTSGKRKRAIARATLVPGTGVVRINGQLLDTFGSNMTRLRLKEPLILAGDIANKVNISVSVSGGGVNGLTDASRVAISRALVEFSGKSSLRETFLEYNRNLLVADVRRKEMYKPNDSKARAKRQKSYR